MRKETHPMYRSRERGLTIPLLALFIVILIAMMGLAIDMGVLYTARTSAQHAADSAALAGAFTYGDTTASNPNGSAKAAALSAATNNKILGAAVPASEVTVTTNPPYVTVSITHVEPTYFAKVIGQNQATITVSATAQALLNPEGTSCLRPFWILRSALGGCSSTPAAGQAITLHNPTNPNCQGGSAPSQWGFINMNGGASAIGSAIQTCQYVTVKCGDPMTAETGNISSINHLNPTPEFFGSNPDYWYGPNDYALGGPNGPRSPNSESVIMVAVLDDCNGQTPPQQGANQTLNILAFSEIFVDGISGNGNGCNTPLTVNANLVRFNACGAGAGGAGGGIGSYGPKVMLVQAPSQ
jgi:Flp pilus assembly protein TadG